ncbi:MAG: YbaK/EbsC family protein [Gammaproteobacteria bacterium]|nr:YbaK/EbsC family protein [Gammaproteobacteria bacterium]
MKPANLKVKTCLQQAGLEFEIRILPAAVRTARLAADALGCEVGQIANSLIFRDLASDRAVLVMCAGDRRVDPQKVQFESGIELGKADADFVRHQTGFAIGGVPPVAHTQPLRTLLDDSLMRHAEIWAAAGTPESVFRMSPAQLQQITGGEWLDIAAT